MGSSVSPVQLSSGNAVEFSLVILEGLESPGNREPRFSMGCGGWGHPLGDEGMGSEEDRDGEILYTAGHIPSLTCMMLHNTLSMIVDGDDSDGDDDDDDGGGDIMVLE